MILSTLKCPSILAHAHRTFSLQRPNPDHSNLLHLITHHRFHAAEHVLRHLLNSGVEPHTIPPHPAFEFAALFALQREQDPEYRARQFTKWFRFIPDIRHHSSTVISFRDDHTKSILFPPHRHQKQPLKATLDTLFRSGKLTSDMTSLIEQFALISASKGYIHHIHTPVLEFLASQPIPSTDLIDFISQMEASAIQYERTGFPPSPPCAQKLTRQLRITTIQLLCRFRRHQGVKHILVRNARDTETILPDEVYHHVIKDLRGDSSVQGRRLVRRIKMLNKLREVEAAKRPSFKSQEELEAAHLSSPATLSSTLRSCRHRLRTIETTLLQTNSPHLNPTTLRRVFHAIIQSRSLLSSIPENGQLRTTAWLYHSVLSEYKRLRAVALGWAHNRYAESWLGAEMSVLDHQRNWKEILRLVSSHYSLAHLPSAYIDVLSTIRLPHEYPGVEPDVVDHEKVALLDSASKDATIFLKWLVILTATRSLSPKGDLTKLWNVFSSTTFKAPVFNLLSAFVWSFAWIGQPSCHPGTVLPEEGLALLPTVVYKLNGLWQGLASDLGRSPTWDEFEVAVRDEWEVDVLAEGYLSGQG